MKLSPLHPDPAPCTCMDAGDDTACPVHGTPEFTDADMEPVVPEDFVPIEDAIAASDYEFGSRVHYDDHDYYFKRTYKFRIEQPINEDAFILVFIKYEYWEAEFYDPTSGQYHSLTQDGHSYVFIGDKWEEYRGYQVFKTEKMPKITGIQMETNRHALDRALQEGLAAIENLNEREDSYRYVIHGQNTPVIHVNAPTGEQVQEIIDNNGEEV